jgi:hypothetical protein
MLWSKCRMETFYGDEASDVIDCQVRIGDGQIVVSYDEEAAVQVYQGNDDGSGHFVLQSKINGGRATLHFRTPGEDVLEGSWIEEGYSGMWSIDLN